MVLYETNETNSIELVSSYIKALNEENFALARNFFGKTFTYTSPMATLDNPDNYINFMAKQPGIRYQIKKIFAAGSDVCLLYDLTVGNKTNFSCGWCTITNGKIQSLRVLMPYTSFK